MALNKKIAVVAVILIVAAAILLSFNSINKTTKSAAGSSCVNAAGFVCYNVTYSHNGNLTVTLGQNTQQNWALVSFLFVPENTSYSNGVPAISWNGATTLHNGLPHNTTATVILYASGSVPIGTALNGAIWTSYQQEVGGTVYYAKIGTIYTHAS